jgi:8-oxo-dGTP diphosphatase
MAVVFSEDREKVLLHRREVFFLWDLPGGGIEKGESAEQAAVRETREEMGYEIAVERFVGTYTHQAIYSSGDQETKVFRGHVIGGKMKRFGLESTELKWVDIHGLPRGLEQLHRQIIADALVDSPMPVNRRIEFSKWKLYPARLVFTFMRFRNYFIRSVLKKFRLLTRNT